VRHLVDVTPPGAQRYPVLCGRDPAHALAALWDARWHKVAIIGDDTTVALFARPIAEALAARGAEVIELGFAPGEASKIRATKERLEDAMLAAGLDRNGCVVAVGGGIALDLAGFVAATYLRGIAHIHVATTLLAQVDAAVGGKTGVNCARGKNLIGAFHHPRAVLIDTGALASLPAVELRNGLAEGIKHAALADLELFTSLERWADDDPSGVPGDEIIAGCVAIKAAIVAEDDRDQGRRNVLNFGHTAAHAIEAATGYAVPHGHAVAAGMVIELRLACDAGWLDPADLGRMMKLLERVGLPHCAPCSFEAALPFFAADKKTVDGLVHCAIPQRLGQIEPVLGRFTRAVSLEQLERAWSS
jgi:3-dehydroquinate synthase